MQQCAYKDQKIDTKMPQLTINMLRTDWPSKQRGAAWLVQRQTNYNINGRKGAREGGDATR